MTQQIEPETSLSFRIAGMYGLIFSCCFLIYGAVKIVLGFLDRNYTDMGNPIFYLIVGLVLIAFVIAYREFKKWGWYGMVAINGLVVILGIVMYNHYIDIITLVLSGIVLYFLFSKSTRQYFLKS